MKNSNKFIFILFCLFLFIAVIYFLANSVIQIPEGSFTIFKDKKTGEIGILSPGRHYLLQGLFPERIILRSFRNLNSGIFNLKIEIPLLESLNKDSLSVKMSFNVLYSIDNKNISVSNISLEKDNDIFDDLIARNIKANLKNELMPYFSPLYRPDFLINESNKTIERVFIKLKQRTKDIGLDIQKFELITPIELPTKEVFNNELKYLSEIGDIEKNNKKELLILQNKLLNEQKANSAYYNKLHEISKLIKENPDLLKYIYIDKISDKVKVIINSDKSMPSGLYSNDFGLQNEK